MTDSLQCTYQPAWQSRCENTGYGTPCLCKNHQGKECWCGKPAVKECNVASSFVCGAPTCEEHGCNLVAAGLTGSHGNKHSTKGYEQYQEWLVQRGV